MPTKHKSFDDGFDQGLRRQAASLPAAPPPAALRARILGHLPAAPARPVPPRLRLIATGLAACAAAGLLVVGLHSGLRPASAAEVRAAILRTNTWHFVGWHLRDGHKVRWEVWGRRSPALYREQIGDEVYLDDGTRSTHVLPPDPKNGRPHGVVLILPSRPQTTPALADSGTNFLVGIGGDAAGFSPRGPAGNDETFEARTEYAGYPTDIKETTTLTVNRSTHLPVRYVVRRVESQPKGKPGVGAGLNYRALRKLREYTHAELVPSYDVPLPVAVAAVRPPAGYVVTDANDAPPALGAPAGGVATQGGLTVRTEVVAQDAEGDLRLRFHAWVGRQPLSYRDTGLYLDGLNHPGHYGTDDLGNAYLFIECPGPLGNDDGGVDLWLVPLEPLAPKAPPPAALDLNAALGLSRYERMGQSGRTIPVATEHMTFHLRLPVEKQGLGFDAVVRDAGHHGMQYVGPLPSLATEAAEARALDYWNRPVLFAGGKLVHKAGFGPNYERAAYWWGMAAQAAARTGDTRRADVDRQNVSTMRRLQQQSRP